MPQPNPHQIDELRRTLMEMVDGAIEDAAQLICLEIRQPVNRSDSEKLALLAKLEALPALRRALMTSLEDGRKF